MLNLSSREKLLVKLLAATVACIVFYFVILSPAIEFKSGVDSRNSNNASKLQKLDKLYEEYQAIKIKNMKIEGLIGGQGTANLIEESARTTNLHRNRVYSREMPSVVQNKYKKTTTEIKFEGVGIKSLVDFIYKLENSNTLVKISYINIKEAIKTRSTYDVIMKIDTISMQQ